MEARPVAGARGRCGRVGRAGRGGGGGLFARANNAYFCLHATSGLCALAMCYYLTLLRENLSRPLHKHRPRPSAARGPHRERVTLSSAEVSSSVQGPGVTDARPVFAGGVGSDIVN